MGSSPDDGQTTVGTTAHTTLSLARHQNRVLVYDPADVEHMELSMPNDVRELPTEPEDTHVRRELGQAHVHLSLHFKEGKRARWVPAEEAAEPASEIDVKNLEIEELGAALRSRCEISDEHQARAVSAEVTLDGVRALVARWERAELAPQTVQFLDELRFVLPAAGARDG